MTDLAGVAYADLERGRRALRRHRGTATALTAALLTLAAWAGGALHAPSDALCVSRPETALIDVPNSFG